MYICAFADGIHGLEIVNWVLRLLIIQPACRFMPGELNLEHLCTEDCSDRSRSFDVIVSMTVFRSTDSTHSLLS